MSAERSRPGSSVYPKSPLGENDPRVATGRDVEWEPLVDYRRAGVSETTIHGAIGWASGGKVVHSFGGNVLCVVTPVSGDGLVAAVVTTIDNKTGDTKNALMTPNGGVAATGGASIGF